LKKRQAFCGDRAKTRMAEAKSLKELNIKVDMTMEHLNLQVPKKSPDADERAR
jgi:hypothetical protein